MEIEIKDDSIKNPMKKVYEVAINLIEKGAKNETTSNQTQDVEQTLQDKVLRKSDKVTKEDRANAAFKYFIKPESVDLQREEELKDPPKAWV